LGVFLQLEARPIDEQGSYSYLVAIGTDCDRWSSVCSTCRSHAEETEREVAIMGVEILHLDAEHKVICKDIDDLDVFPKSDLTLFSPPYEDAREYGLGKEHQRKGQAWVDWISLLMRQMAQTTNGLVVCICAGRTRRFEWSATPARLMVALADAPEMIVRNPPIYKRNGIFGSGGPDWLRSDYEWCICASLFRRLPWADNTACGHPPKYPPGGNPSHRRKDGTRVSGKAYKPPQLANPGNVIDCGAVGGGHMGSSIAEENEAPYPEQLAEFFIRSFCPPGGTVFDPFGGSGTTMAMAIKTGRRSVSCDIRASQIELMKRRYSEAKERWPAN
jgi:hypothetical protein